MPLTPSQATQVARDLKNDFASHADQALRRQIRQRKLPVDWEALGLEERVKNIAPFQSNTASEEAHRYANALSSAGYELAVFAGDSEKITRQKIGERLENFYDAMVTVLMGDDYERCLDLAAEGFGVGRLDLKPQFWKGIPDRGDLENEPYLSAFDDERKAIGLPFTFPRLDPLTFYYEEDKNREITVGVEWGRRKQTVLTETYKKNEDDPEKFLGPTVPEGISQGKRMVDFVVVRTPDIIYHAVMGNDPKGSKDNILWEGPNIFAPSTGYIAWRGLPSGYAEMDERYLPLIMNSLNLAQQKNLGYTIENNLAILAMRMWTEQPDTKAGGVGQQIMASAKGAGKTRKSDKGNIVADMETGRIVRWRDMAEGVSVMLQRLDLEEDRYRFPEPLAPESSSGESGRDTIRRQEASSKLLTQGYTSRERAIAELVTVCRRTMFGHKDFLKDGRLIYLRHLVEGLGPDGTLRKQDLISISEEDNIPHQVTITISNSSQASQLALNEEGIRLQGHLSQDTRFQDYFGVKDIPLEQHRLQKDIIRAATYPETVKRAIIAVNDSIAARTPESDTDLLVPEQEAGGARVPGPAISAQPTPSQPEDAGLAISGNGTVA